MNPSLDKALYYLTGNGNMDESSLENVQKLVVDYPFFSVGQLLLAKKLKNKNDNNFESQLQKTALYITNPYWLHYQLLNYPPAEIEMFSNRQTEESDHAKALEQQFQPAIEGPEVLPSTNENSRSVRDEDVPLELQNIHSNTTSDSAQNLNEQPVIISTDFTNKETATASAEAHEPLVETNHNIIEVEPTGVPITTVFSKEEIKTASALAHEQLAENNTDVNTVDPVDVPITTVFTIDEIETASALAHEQLSPNEEESNTVDALSLPSSTGLPIKDEATDRSSSEQEYETDEEEIPFVKTISTNRFTVEEIAPELENDLQPKPEEAAWNDESKLASPEKYLNEFEPAVDTSVEESPVAVSQPEEEMAALARDTNPATEAFIAEIETVHEEVNHDVNSFDEQPAELDEHELMFQNIKAMLDATTEEADKKVDGAIIPIDPYHTIDYFASQGIKLDLDPNPQDKLGKQVKKFTQWLRHMKKLGPEDAIETMKDDQAETEIQHIADSSNTAREVVTEAMAQVLEKQGKTEKAIQLYTKLSFFNPHKSAYFADKINKLKES